ncbi:hypothetical protein Dtox_1724 [Desulfofarcimen acetoxidans DSM 771]|jgi:hypothetical protein|uniref:Uncharacterized protein n=1 Tax=Desulfofarcimen acetoxidans (strain ATCC 49208 / DSM 771 / KCTC 5769 / VKM B-1644 / 5575) TaxID=485916 RepID=C8VX05_DESAS|nr:hypothetical protein [Desulfofarcimen acetoxidans]ACV62581.1 hypothetical protein Dtox_1724 [Desulfofarcimen acetoxidans DSM 771]
MSLEINPFTLFLILILLILSMQPNSEDELDEFAGALEAIKESTTHFRTGLARIQGIIN